MNLMRIARYLPAEGDPRIASRKASRKTMTPEQIVQEFRHLIEAEARRNNEHAHKQACACIRSICACCEIEEYDWKNSSEGFDSWIMRVFADNPPVRAEMLRLWRLIEGADEHFRRIYYGLNPD